jgi:hypothetical protein
MPHEHRWTVAKESEREEGAMSDDLREFGEAMHALRSIAAFPKEQLEQLKASLMAMSDNPRDTQFAGFATLLFEELKNTEAFEIVDAEQFWGGNLKAEVQRIIAQRAYDLVKYILSAASGQTNIDEVMPFIPDMTEWPHD